MCILGDLILPIILCQYLCVFWGFYNPNYFVPIFVCILGDLIFPSVESDSGASSQVEDLPHSGDQVLAVSCICSFSSFAYLHISHLHICTTHIFLFAYLHIPHLLICHLSISTFLIWIFAYFKCSIMHNCPTALFIICTIGFFPKFFAIFQQIHGLPKTNHSILY